MAFKCQRWTLANMLPVIFVVWVIAMIYGTYTGLHLVPLLRRDRDAFCLQAAISNLLTALMLVCFGRAMFTDPGSVPDAPEWRDVRGHIWQGGLRPGQSGEEEGGSLLVHEVKQTGGRRFCKWCDSFKPDRCHHCRVCKSCILRMDHHCPWIANCVGFRNHKWFFLLVMYAFLSCAFIFVTMSQSLMRSLTFEYRSSRDRFLMVFGLTLAAIMAVLLKLFFSFHVWLMLRATTTIELCEKRSRQDSAKPLPEYEQGAFENIRAVLGPNPLLWLLPVSPPVGDGLYFPVRGARPRGKSAGSEVAGGGGPKRAQGSLGSLGSSANEQTSIPPPEGQQGDKQAAAT